MADAKRWLRGALPVTITVAALAALATYLVRNRDYIAQSYELRPGVIAVVAGLIVVTLVLRAAANRLLFRRLGADASLRDWFAVVTMTAFTNYLPLSAGTLAKGFVLKRLHDLPYRLFAVAQVVLLILVVSTNGAVGLGALAALRPDQNGAVVALGFGAMVLAIGVLFLPEAAARRLGGSWFPWEANAAPEVRRSWPGVALCQVGTLAASAGTLQLCFGMGATDVPFSACLIFTAATVLTRLVSFTPGAIGIREFLIGALASLTGFGLRDAVIASTLARTVEVVVILLLGGGFGASLSRRVASSYGQTDAPSPAERPE